MVSIYLDLQSVIYIAMCQYSRMLDILATIAGQCETYRMKRQIVLHRTQIGLG